MWVSGERRYGNRAARSGNTMDDREDALMEQAEYTVSHGHQPERYRSWKE